MEYQWNICIKYIQSYCKNLYRDIIYIYIMKSAILCTHIGIDAKQKRNKISHGME